MNPKKISLTVSLYIMFLGVGSVAFGLISHSDTFLLLSSLLVLCAPYWLWHMCIIRTAGKFQIFLSIIQVVMGLILVGVSVHKSIQYSGFSNSGKNGLESVGTFLELVTALAGQFLLAGTILLVGIILVNETARFRQK